MLEKIQALYREYEEEYRRLERTQKLGAGMFGLGGGPRDDPCHERFARDLERLLQEEPAPGPEQAKDVLEFIWFAPAGQTERRDAVSWMQIAVHSLTPPLITRLDPAAAAGLLKRYEAAYPRQERLPAQKKVISALRKRIP